MPEKGSVAGMGEAFPVQGGKYGGTVDGEKIQDLFGRE
jgi:hypothetical protein